MSETDPASTARRARDALEAELTASPSVAVTLPGPVIDRLERYVALLLAANARLNLTRVVEPLAIARLHLLDALAALPLIDPLVADRAVDLGSGGGVPAIPLAIARPELRWLLVESVGKKAITLRSFIEALALTNVRVAAERAEVVGRAGDERERADLVTARACAPLPVVVELAMPLLRPSGVLLAWKGPLGREDAEIRRGRTALGELGGGRLTIEPTGFAALGGHTFVVAQKRGPTPPRYPRRVGEPGRRPLG